jgi:hypothetical protein
MAKHIGHSAHILLLSTTTPPRCSLEKLSDALRASLAPGGLTEPNEETANLKGIREFARVLRKTRVHRQ